MKPHIEISKQLQDLYGPNRIVIGKAGEKIYFDLPDDPEVFAHLIKRMFQALAVRDMDDHLHALAQQMEQLISLPLDTPTVKVDMGKTVDDADFDMLSNIHDTEAFKAFKKMMEDKP